MLIKITSEAKMLNFISVLTLALFGLITVNGALLGTLPFTNDNEAVICCLDLEWEAQLYLDYGTVFIDQNTAFAYINGSVRAAYSMAKKKIVYNITGVEQTPLIPKPEPDNTFLLYDFANHMSYMLADDGSCQKSSLEENMTRYCIPHSAKELSRGIFSHDNTTRLIHTYQYKTDIDIPFEITATIYKDDLHPIEPKTCGPISVSFFTPSENPDSGTLYNLQSTDFGPIRSPDIFDVPGPCQNI